MYNNICFYNVDKEYINFLKESEKSKRGFSRVPDFNYENEHKSKFICGIVLKVNQVDYYVPVSSFKQDKPDNFLIKDKKGNVVSSLRFNYMFPVPDFACEIKQISDESDEKYKNLLLLELKYCQKNKEKIFHLAERTYKRVLLGKDVGLVKNSCDFLFLEKQCLHYIELENERQRELAELDKELEIALNSSEENLSEITVVQEKNALDDIDESEKSDTIRKQQIDDDFCL